MIRSVLTIACIVLFGALASTTVAAQSYRVGFVNTETIIKELPEAQKASADIEEKGMKIRDTLQMMQKEFETRLQEYTKQEALMSADAKAKEQEALNGLRARFLQYQETKTAEMQQLRENFLKPIREKVAKAIEEIAAEEKLNMVLDKTAGLVLYSENSADITFKVLDRMQRGNK